MNAKTILNSKENSPGSYGRRAGFSLIEVTVSIAITAVALVSLMGMLPAGMKTMREAADRAVETRIHQQVLSELQLVKWTSRFQFDYRMSGSPGVRFYDDQGIQIYKNGSNAMSDDEFDRSHVYTARINVPSRGQALPQSISGGSYAGTFVPASMTPDPSLQLVIVEITSVIDEAFETSSGFDDTKFLKTIRTFQATITKLGKDFGS